MKKQLLGLMTILSVLGACQKNEVSVSLPEEVTIHATIEGKDATKTIMDESNNILWSENDQIIAFMKSSYGHKYQVKPSFVGKSYADFSMVSSNNGSDLSAGNEWGHNVIYYPYSENIECLKSGANYALEVNLPAEQTYVPDSFANGSMAMVAVSESNNITFRNVLGGIKLQLKGTQKVASIKIEGKNNEKLSGSATVTAYTDENKPAITMASSASTSVTLNCGEGVQLNESTATELIISLPPVLFSKGFIVNVTDSNGETLAIETDKVNTVIRSSLLVMPTFKLNTLEAENPDDNDGNSPYVPVTTVILDESSLTFPQNISYTVTAKVKPFDATDQTITWSSDDSSIVSIDQTGMISTLSDGTARIYAEAGGVIGICEIKVISSQTEGLIDYIDEYGINHGKGIAIENTVWAPVNCGYKAKTNDNKGFPYGKLYQRGRKYGQGYSTSYDESVPEVVEGPVTIGNGQDSKYENYFFTASYQTGKWADPQDDNLWNNGTDEHPIKTLYDPCPEGWRIPTHIEIDALNNHSSWTKVNGVYGRVFSGNYNHPDLVPNVFLPAAGVRNYNGKAEYRGSSGYYWSSGPYENGYSKYIYLSDNYGPIYTDGYRAYAMSIRCVQE